MVKNLSRRIRPFALALGLILTGGGLGACASAENAPPSGAPKHHTADGFRNPHAPAADKNIFDYMAAKYFGDDEWADHAALSDEVEHRQARLPVTPPRVGEFEVTWLGHSTFLIRTGDVTVLTDPVFADRASPVSFAGPKRYVPHVIDYADLPPIDYVVISHSHYDHLDEAAIEQLGDEPVYMVPLRLGQWFVDQGVDPARVQEFDWWDRQSFDGGAVEVLATPSQHWSARGLFDRNETLWASWLLDIGGARLWFAGDTGYNEVQFKEIGERAGRIDLALIPIGGYAPRWFMGTHHVDPEGAIKIHRDIGATRSIGMHWGTFPLTAEGPMDPPRELAARRLEYELAEEEFSWMTLGETVSVPGDERIAASDSKE